MSYNNQIKKHNLFVTSTRIVHNFINQYLISANKKSLLLLLLCMITTIGSAKDSPKQKIYSMTENGEPNKQLFVINNYYFYDNSPFIEFVALAGINLDNVATVKSIETKTKIDSILSDFKDERKKEVEIILYIHMNKDAKLDFQHLDSYRLSGNNE